jgi:hypothetical protein
MHEAQLEGSYLQLRFSRNRTNRTRTSGLRRCAPEPMRCKCYVLPSGQRLDVATFGGPDEKTSAVAESAARTVFSPRNVEARKPEGSQAPTDKASHRRGLAVNHSSCGELSASSERVQADERRSRSSGTTSPGCGYRPSIDFVKTRSPFTCTSKMPLAPGTTSTIPTRSSHSSRMRAAETDSVGPRPSGDAVLDPRRCDRA